MSFWLPFFLGGATVLIAEILIVAAVAVRMLRWTRGDDDVFPKSKGQALKGEGDEA